MPLQYGQAGYLPYEAYCWLHRLSWGHCKQEGIKENTFYSAVVPFHWLTYSTRSDWDYEADWIHLWKSRRLRSEVCCYFSCIGRQNWKSGQKWRPTVPISQHVTRGRKPHTTPFWLDTICCPVDDGPEQSIAFNLMQDTCSKASAVLVLEGTLLNCNIESLANHKILLRVFISSWMNRFWTLQEGASTKQLYFQFADIAYNL